MICSQYLKPKKGVKFKQARSSLRKCRNSESCAGNTEQAGAHQRFPSACRARKIPPWDPLCQTAGRWGSWGTSQGQGVTPHQGTWPRGCPSHMALLPRPLSISSRQIPPRAHWEMEQFSFHSHKLRQGKDRFKPKPSSTQSPLVIHLRT